MKRRKAIRLVQIALITVAATASIAGLWYWMRSSANAPAGESARLIGSSACASCHPDEYTKWLESNHRHAMEPPSDASVLGNFNNAEYRYFGRTTRFFKEGSRFRITTENQQGKPETFDIAYTLGYRPLQQYLVDIGGGRLQALPFAWDTRALKDGGQRWFHLYPKDNITPSNPLFWMRPLQNWNHMCGDCHTTGFAKNFNEERNAFASNWNEAGNGCESCHGAGSAHIQSMQTAKAGHADAQSISVLRTPQEQIQQCGACHSRRVRLREASFQNRKMEEMLETWRPQLPQDGLYFVDGQIREEVFEIGSFLQSKMAAKGVRCTDCHDPHSSRLKAEGNALCTQCHAPEKFDTTTHHAHENGTAGAQCVNCHMPARTYMVVHARRDHRIAIPRPDMSEKLGTPNPCIECHQDKTNSWASDAIRTRTLASNPSKTTAAQPWGIAAWMASREQTGAEEQVRNILSGEANPIVKATVLASIRALTPDAFQIVQSQLSASDPLVRLGAMQAVSPLPLPQRASLLIQQLHDPLLAVRLQVFSMLVGLDKSTLNAEQRKDFETARSEYRTWLTADADRADALVSLAELEAAEGDAVSAQTAFEKALQRDETSLSALLNYADFQRARGNDAAAEPLLNRAAVLYPDSANVHFAIGLLRVRQKRVADAVPELARAAELAPDESNFKYVYAVSLYTTDRFTEALTVLDKARHQFPANTQIASAMKAYCDEQMNGPGKQPTSSSGDRRMESICLAYRAGN